MKILKTLTNAINDDDLLVMKECYKSQEYQNLLKNTANFYNTDMIYFHDSSFIVLSERQTNVLSTKIEVWANCDEVEDVNIKHHAITFIGNHPKLRKFNGSIIDMMFFEQNANGSYKVHMILMSKTNHKRFYISFITNRIEISNL